MTTKLKSQLKVIFIESPNKKKKIQKYANSSNNGKFIVIPTIGHFRGLFTKKGLKSAVDVNNNFKPTYEIKNNNVYKEMKKIMKKVKKEDVYLGADLDREGALINFHICQALKLDVKKVKVLKYNEITKTAIAKAISNPKIGLDMNMVNSAQARCISDLLIGFSLCPILWKHISIGKISAGRTQSPALKLVSDKKIKIEKFKPESYFETDGNFEHKESNNIIVGKFIKKYKTNKEIYKLLDDCKTADFIVNESSKKEGVSKPPAPFTTSSLQQTSSSKLGMSPKQTMSTAQNLFAEGLITYHRTDSVNLSKDILDKMGEYIPKKFGKEYYQRRVYKTKKKGAQEAHECCRCSDIEKSTIKTDNSYKKRLYELIYKRTLASQMANAKKDVFKIVLTMSNRSDKISSVWENITFLGYLKIYGIKLETAKEINLKKGTIMKYKDITSNQKFSKAKGRYNDASLVKGLESNGIGRPSTFANIIETLYKREYIKKDTTNGIKTPISIYKLLNNKITEKKDNINVGQDKNKIHITEMGQLVNDFLAKHFNNVINYKFTSEMETKLDTIAKGNIVWQNIVKEIYDSFMPKVKELSSKSTILAKDEYKRLLGQIGGKNVYAYLAGRNAVVRIGEDNEDKKTYKYGNLEKNQTVKTITLKQAKKLLQYPKEIGRHEDKIITLNKGKFGFYLKYDDKNFGIKDLEKPDDFNLEDSIKIIKEKKKNNLIKEIGKNIKIRNGPYGPYIHYKKKTFVSIPKNIKPEDITKEKVLELIEDNKKNPKKKFRKFKKKN